MPDMVSDQGFSFAFYRRLVNVRKPINPELRIGTLTALFIAGWFLKFSLTYPPGALVAYPMREKRQQALPFLPRSARAPASGSRDISGSPEEVIRTILKRKKGRRGVYGAGKTLPARCSSLLIQATKNSVQANFTVFHLY